MRSIPISIGSLFLALASMSAHAVPVNWTDWQSSASNTTAAGQLTVGATTVDVNYSGTGAHAFVQNGVTGNLTNYWSGTAYTNGNVDNAPTPAEGVSLSQGGTVTVNFSQAILNPFIAMNSWNGNVVDFGVPITIDSFGPGYWGSGTAILNGTGTGFTGSGEFHGVISLSGSFTSISFTHTSENWHGFTVGVEGLGEQQDVPEPGPLALWALGLLGLAFARKRA